MKPPVIRLGMPLRTVGGVMAQLCDQDDYYFTIVSGQSIRRINRPIFYEALGWDDRAQVYYLHGISMPCVKPR